MKVEEESYSDSYHSFARFPTNSPAMMHERVV